MFKTSHLGILNFGFLSLYPFRTKNANFIPDSKPTPFPKRRSFSFEVKGKIGIPLGFSVHGMDKSERKPNFDIPK
jgi:hypothetical protein